MGRWWMLFVLLICCSASEAWGASDQCRAMAKVEVSAGQLSLATHGARVTSWKWVADHGRGFCKLLGEILPVDSEADPIRFEINLPEHWNRKAVQFGGGAFDGYLS